MPKGYPKNGVRAAGRQGNLSRTPEYAVWSAMNQRCSRPNAAQFDDYGGRGIAVCEEWRTSFVKFLSDMGKRPSPLHTIERKNNDGNYEPSNCIWATREHQVRNRRSNVNLTHDGITMNLADWSRRVGLPYANLLDRLKRGLTIPEILNPARYNTGPNNRRRTA